MLNSKPANSKREYSLHENMRYVFDRNDTSTPPGDPSQESFKLTVMFNGIDIDEELMKFDFLNLVFNKLAEATEDKEERLQLEAAIENLNEQKIILLENVTTFLDEFLRELVEMDDELSCPQCGKPYIIQYTDDEDEDRCTSAAG